MTGEGEGVVGANSSPKSMRDTSLLGLWPEPAVLILPCLEAETHAAGLSLRPLTEPVFRSDNLFSPAAVRSSSSFTGS